jgi:hypothetical protein
LGESITKKDEENAIFIAKDAATVARIWRSTLLSCAEDELAAKGSIDVGTVPGATSDAETPTHLSN